MVDAGYFSLHRFLRDTSSDIEGLTDHQLTADRSPWTPERNIWIHIKLAKVRVSESACSRNLLPD